MYEYILIVQKECVLSIHFLCEVSLHNIYIFVLKMKCGCVYVIELKLYTCDLFVVNLELVVFRNTFSFYIKFYTEI